MHELVSQQINCPYCGEEFKALIDTSENNNQYTEDCYICCRPIVFYCFIDDTGSLIVNTHTEDESF